MPIYKPRDKKTIFEDDDVKITTYIIGSTCNMKKISIDFKKIGGAVIVNEMIDYSFNAGGSTLDEIFEELKNSHEAYEYMVANKDKFNKINGGEKSDK